MLFTSFVPRRSLNWNCSATAHGLQAWEVTRAGRSCTMLCGHHCDPSRVTRVGGPLPALTEKQWEMKVWPP